MRIQSLAIVVLLLDVTACSSSVRHVDMPSATAVTPTAVTKDHPVGQVTIHFSEKAKKEATESLKFSADQLVDHIKRGLKANDLWTENDPASALSLDVEMTHVRVRSNFNAIMWGFMAGADSLGANVLLKDGAGKTVDAAEVGVSYALGGIGGGDDNARMSWLYEKFTEETLKELQTPGPSAPKK